MRQKGFTLVELAIVMVVIGLLIGLGAGMIWPLIKQAKYTQSRDIVNAAKTALLGYTVKNGFAPLSTSDAFGAAGARTLDAWTRNLIYSDAPSLDGPGYNACGVTATTLTVFECTNSACSTWNQKSNIVFIAYSKGEDANDAATTTNPSTPGFGCTSNCPSCPGGDTCFYIRQPLSGYTAGGATYAYDDIVQYGTLDEIRSARNCSFTITNTSLPNAATGALYSVALNGAGGTPPYIWATGQAQGACASGSVRLVGSDIGLCLNAATGLISGTPTTANVYNFTVTLTDINGVTASQAFTLNVIDSCALTGINIVNNTNTALYFSRNGSGCTGPWAAGANLNTQAGASGGVQPNDTYYFFTDGGCTSACPGTPNLNYSGAKNTDSNNNCQMQFTGGTCIRSDL